MMIQTITIDSFGLFRNQTFSFSEGINLIRGNNESGKTTLCEFIKFCLFGFAPRSDKKKYLSEETGSASGWIELRHEDKVYRVQRKAILHGSTVSESFSVLDLTNCRPVETANPGETFFGLTRELFSQICYISQLLSGKPDSEELTQQIDNLFTSGDENTNVKKALKILETKKKSLSKKNGILDQLEREIAEREVLLEENREKNKEILAGELSLKKAEDEYRRSDEQSAKASITREAIETMETLSMFDRLHAMEAELTEKEISLQDLKEESSYQFSLPDREYAGKLNNLAKELEKDQAVMEEAQAHYTDVCERKAAFKKEMPSVIEDRLNEVEELFDKKRRKTAFSILFLAIAAVSGAVCVFLWKFFRDAVFLFGFGITLIFAILGVIGIAGILDASEKINSILKGAGAISLPDYREILRKNQIRILQKERLSEEFASVEKQFSERKKAFFDSYKATEAHLALLNIKENDISTGICKAIDKCRDYAKQSEKLAEEIRLISARISDYQKNLETKDEAALRIFAENNAGLIGELTAERIEEFRKSEKFDDARTDSLRLRITSLREKLASLKTNFIPPSDLSTELENLKEKYAELNFRCDAAALAEELLTSSVSDIRADLMPTLAKTTSEIVGGITGGKYLSITLNDRFKPNCVTSDSVVRDLDYVSSGTQDLIYLTMRLSLVSYLSSATQPPVIFDESFAQIDDERTLAFFRYALEKYHGQMILLSSNDREEIILGQSVSYNLIRL